MSTEEWQKKSDRLANHLQSSPLFTHAQTILAYFSFRREPDLSPLFAGDRGTPQTLDQRPTAKRLRRWGFSRCIDKSLSWHIWQPGDPLQTGAYGIVEPHPDSPLLQPNEVDLILVPSVACDFNGYRLGYGGGFYDRLLSSPEWASKPTIGIVFEFAYLPQLPVEPWDKPLQAVCTETGLQILPSSAQ